MTIGCGSARDGTRRIGPAPCAPPFRRPAGSCAAAPMRPLALQRFIDRVGFFLNLAAITALLVGGVGIGNAVTGYVAGKTAAIATLEVSRRLDPPGPPPISSRSSCSPFSGIVLGLIVGGIAPALVAPLLKGLLPVSLRLGLYPAPLAIAGLCGFLTTLVFALWPLAAIGQVSPASLFRDRVAPAPRHFRPAGGGGKRGIGARPGGTHRLQRRRSQGRAVVCRGRARGLPVVPHCRSAGGRGGQGSASPCQPAITPRAQ